MSLTKVNKGDTFRFPASDYNAFIDMTRGRKTDSIRKYRFSNSKTFEFYNNTGSALPMYACMDIQNRFAEDEEKIILNGINPVVLPLNGGILPPLAQTRVCVIQSPLQDQGVGNAVYQGITKVKLKKETGLDTTKPMRVIKINGDNTQLAVTNRETPDDLLWHNFDYSLGIVHLGKYPINATPFVGILDCVPDTIAGRVKIVVINYYTGKSYQIVGATTSTYRQLTISPPRPRSTAVIAQFTYKLAGIDYCEFQPFYSTDLEGVVKYDDLQLKLNNTVLGRRSSKDRIASRYVDGLAGVGSKALLELWGQEV